MYDAFSLSDTYQNFQVFQYVWFHLFYKRSLGQFNCENLQLSFAEHGVIRTCTSSYLDLFNFSETISIRCFKS